MCSSSVPAHPAAGRASGLPKRDLRSPCSTPVVPAPIGTTASTSAPSSLKYRDRAPEHIRKTRPIQQHCYACTEYNYDWFCNDLEEPYTAPTDKPFSWLGRMRIAGGRTNVWGRACLRLSDLDFKAASRDGFDEDWPLRYSDLEPYYDLVEDYVGVTGIGEGAFMNCLTEGFSRPWGLPATSFCSGTVSRIGWAGRPRSLPQRTSPNPSMVARPVTIAVLVKGAV